MLRRARASQLAALKHGWPAGRPASDAGRWACVGLCGPLTFSPPPPQVAGCLKNVGVVLWGVMVWGDTLTRREWQVRFFICFRVGGLRRRAACTGACPPARPPARDLPLLLPPHPPTAPPQGLCHLPPWLLSLHGGPGAAAAEAAQRVAAQAAVTARGPASSVGRVQQMQMQPLPERCYF